jgi:hypothetical protein
VTGIATGDQGIFVERGLFGHVGGFPDQPLMEDVELSRRLKRAAGPPLCLRARITTSGRRWEQHGLARTTFSMWCLRFAHWLGDDPARLAARYGNVRTVDRRPPAPILQVFAKAPNLGAVKTRLAHAIGDAEAAAVHVELVERTLAAAAAARTRKSSAPSSSGARPIRTTRHSPPGATASASRSPGKPKAIWAPGCTMPSRTR